MEYKTWDISRYITKAPQKDGPIDILPEQFCGLIVGQPNSGKTSLLVGLLMAPFAFYGKFDLTLFISPYEIKELNLKKDRWHKVFNVGWVKDRINYYKRFRKVEKVLVYIDDQVAAITAGAKQKEITDFFFNRRKLVDGVEVSIVVTTQKFTRFHSDFRTSCDFHIFFQLPNNDLETVAKELSDNSVTFKAIAKAHWQERPENKPFIILKRTPEYKLFLNFEDIA